MGINGFGRIGRLALRAAVQSGGDIEVVGINDPKSADYLAYMLQYDSVHGRFQGTVGYEGNEALIVNGKRIPLTHERDNPQLKWGEMGVHTVLECTGAFLTA
ncbi:glyceraldehyde 3-phosphate dehydrogenase NAD-binding domain-containing protein, partial [Aquabacterium sp. A08]|uniref:glyceraldehyde 3-phosphate dehydrogenase NAD-binding domain-containing protein n=1 Tax=Aquabacterium sp. A08 TaxID=2718532 RepID=UPI001FBA8E78